MIPLRLMSAISHDKLISSSGNLCIDANSRKLSGLHQTVQFHRTFQSSYLNSISYNCTYQCRLNLNCPLVLCVWLAWKTGDSVVQLYLVDHLDIWFQSKQIWKSVKIIQKKVRWLHFISRTFPYKFPQICENDRWAFVLGRSGEFDRQNYYLCQMCCQLWLFWKKK